MIRDPRPTSQVAGILEAGGGVRTVVTQPWRFKFHLAEGEELFVIPHWWVREPIPYEDWPWVIGRAELEVARRIWPRRLKAWGVPEAEAYFARNLNRLVHDASLFN